jgi:hypothetical protein
MLSTTEFAAAGGDGANCEQGAPNQEFCGGSGGEGGESGSSTVTVDISGTIDNSNTNTLDNSNTFNFGGGEEGEGSFNNTIGDVTGGDSSVVVGDTTLTTGDSTATVGDVSGGNVYIGGGYGEEGEGGSTLSPTSESDSSVTVGDTTLNNGGNTLIVGGGYGEEGEGSGTLNSNAENNVDIDNSSSATGGSVESGAVVVENNVTIEGGGEQIPQANSQTVEGDDVDIQVDARTINEASTVKPAVNSVAPSFSGICNSGAAGQSRGFALSLAVTNDVCQALMIADAYMALGDVEEAHKWVRAAARHAGWKGGLGYIRHLVTLGIL